ncbi:MAG: hypothetical protein E6J73_02450 [Deltaproteobacteria bacterium]|nr:MAG: hypothetical protein E6J73_02450 [Deltaproteobacteria bacterium]
MGVRQQRGHDAARVRPGARALSGDQLGGRRRRRCVGVLRATHKYGLKENPLDSFRRFYVDTADHPASTLRCVKDFFGPDRMVLGTNYPYGPEEGCVLVKNSLKAIDGLELNSTDKEKILGGNAARILGLRAT